MGMRKMGIKIIGWTLAAAVAVSAAVLVVRGCMGEGEKRPPARIEEARIVDIRPMVRLLVTELHEDYPVRAHIGRKHIFARTTLEGTIGFDVEKTEQRWSGDTLFVTLPPEIVEVRESTGKNSYEVIDTWNERFLGSTNFTAGEENEIMEKVRKNWVDSVYRRGYVARARREAVENLRGMLAPLFPGKSVIVTDRDSI